jgi:peroxiredoxin
MEILSCARATAIGQPAPEFTQITADGKPVALSSFKGKFTLVDFWASWCGPCRAENPNVVKAYGRYHSKGFAILGVSLDDKKEDWEAAIKKDKLPWTQVSDLKGWQNSAAQRYGVRGIPMNFLLDKEGKIIGKGLHGEDLQNKLADIKK